MKPGLETKFYEIIDHPPRKQKTVSRNVEIIVDSIHDAMFATSPAQKEKALGNAVFNMGRAAAKLSALNFADNKKRERSPTARRKRRKVGPMTGTSPSGGSSKRNH